MISFCGKKVFYLCYLVFGDLQFFHNNLSPKFNFSTLNHPTSDGKAENVQEIDEKVQVTCLILVFICFCHNRIF